MASLLGAVAGGQEAGDEGEDGLAHVPSFDSRGDLKQDLADVRNVLWWVAGLLTAPALPTLITGLTSRPQAGMEEAEKLWQIFWFTFPLCLGIAIDAPRAQIRFSRPELPEHLKSLTIRNLRVGDASVDLWLERHPHDVGVNLLRRDGEVEIIVVK